MKRSDDIEDWTELLLAEYLRAIQEKQKWRKQAAVSGFGPLVISSNESVIVQGKMLAHVMHADMIIN